MPLLPYSVFLLFLLPLINLGLWIFFPGKKSVAGILPTFFLFVFWLSQLIFKDLSLFSFQEKWIFSNSVFDLNLSFLPDSRRIFFALLSSFMTLLIQIYSLAYLQKIEKWAYYQFLLTIFCLAMNSLFLAGNFFTLLIFWELVGLSSFLLVQFWYEKVNPVGAAIKVFLINKMGDLALISGIGLLVSFGMGSMVSGNLAVPDGAEIFFKSPVGSVLMGFFVLAAMVKSAQFPFSIWLKEAMQGPTAVSALLHSATMVVAGVWLLIQLAPAFGLEMHWILTIIGGFTFMFFNGLAIFSNHLKFILAYSTIAQLGLMTLAIGSGKADQTLFHLASHAFFKAGLFLVCGWLMHTAAEKGKIGDEQQFIPNLEGLLSQQPILKWSFLILISGLAGLPLSAGFISKELLIPNVFDGADSLAWTAFIILQIGIAMTAFYASRLALSLAFSTSNDYHFQSHSSNLFSFPIFLLALFSGFWIFGFHPFSSEGWLAEMLLLKGKPVFPDVFMVLLGMALAWAFAKNKGWKSVPAPGLFRHHFQDLQIFNRAISHSWKGILYLGSLGLKAEDRGIERPIHFFSKTFVVGGYFTSFLDKYLVDGLVNSLASFLTWMGGMLWSQSKRNPQYAVFFIFILLSICLYFSFF